MSLSQQLLPEFDQEMASTRELLLRAKGLDFGWRPHVKSMTLGELTSHLAHLLTWTESILTQASFDIAPKDAPPPHMEVLTRHEDVMAAFDANRDAARARLADTADDEFMQCWSLVQGGTPLFTQPRVVVFRGWILSHAIHHRAQLGVYLRMNDVALPMVYGPTADEEI